MPNYVLIRMLLLRRLGEGRCPTAVLFKELTGVCSLYLLESRNPTFGCTKYSAWGNGGMCGFTDGQCPYPRINMGGVSYSTIERYEVPLKKAS